MLARPDGTAAFGGLEHLLNDNYESPIQAPVALAEEVSPERVASMLKLSVADFASHASTLSSPDELSLFVVRRLMHEVAPSLLWVTLHDIDVAHTGAFSLYLEGIRRSDAICAELWRTIQSDSEYKDKTNPRFGHGCRRKWIPTSPYRGCSLTHHLDDCARSRHQTEYDR
jgi:hypothetical protein